METLERVLTAHPFFEGLESRHMQLLVGCARNEVVKANHPLMKQGEDATWFYLIRQGKVAIEVHSPSRGPLTVQTLGEGEVLGWSWLVPPYKWRFGARAIEPTRVIALDGNCLRTKCEEDHNLGYKLFKRFAQIVTQRLDATRLQLLDVYGPPS